MFSNLLTIKEVTMEEARELFGKRGKQDRVSYYKGKNTRWFLLGDPIIGHASMTKVGIGDEEKESSHYRFGKWYIAPEFRGNNLGPRHAGALIYWYLKYVIPGSSKTVSLRAWDELVEKYQSNGWIQSPNKKFKGPFKELRKIFYFSWGEDLIECRGFDGKECQGIIYPGDYLEPTLFIPLETLEEK